MDRNVFSDYGTGSGSSTSPTGSSWDSLDSWPSMRSQLRLGATGAGTGRLRNSADLLDLVVKQSTMEDMREEFRRNGHDSPYNPEDDMMSRQSGNLIGMVPSSVYLRQKSWPAPESTPAHQLPRPKSEWIPSARAAEFIHVPSKQFRDVVVKQSTMEDMREEFRRNGHDSPYNPEDDMMSRQSGNLIGMGPSSVYLRQKSWPAPESTPAHHLPRPKSEWIPFARAAEFIHVPSKQFRDDSDTISAEQVRVLNSLRNAVLCGLLRDLEQERRANRKRGSDEKECRLCKNNGERESYYRSHALKDVDGRVSCPVLRKFVCKRCGASGDSAHTIKHCPLSTHEERIKSSAMMRSVRLASGRRRAAALAPEPAGDYFKFGDAPPSVFRDYSHCAPLDPLWADLEQKLTF